MKALEFEATIGDDANLRVPSQIAEQIPKATHVRVIVLLPTAAEDSDWAELTNKQFLAGYDEGDSLYDAV